MDRLGLGFDEKVIEWKTEIEATMDTTVSFFIIMVLKLCKHFYYYKTQHCANRSASLLIGGDSLEESFISQESLSPSHSDVLEVQPPIHKQLPTFLSVSIVYDPPESPKSSSSDSSATTNSSLSPDSTTLTPSEVSAESSTVSQPEHTSTPTKSHHQVGAAISSVTNEDQQPATSPVSGFKMVIDNIDKTVKPRHQTIDAQSQSLHYVQVYAMKDRIDFSQLSKTAPSPGRSIYDILPTTSDYQKLKDNFTILVAHILVKHVPYFTQDFSGLLVNHIPHKYSLEMAKKSEVVS